MAWIKSVYVFGVCSIYETFPWKWSVSTKPCGLEVDFLNCHHHMVGSGNHHFPAGEIKAQGDKRINYHQLVGQPYWRGYFLENGVTITLWVSQHRWCSVNGFSTNSFVCALQTVPPKSDHLFSILNIYCSLLKHLILFCGQPEIEMIGDETFFF